MTEVTISYGQHNTHSMRITGHTDSKVCAGVSAIVQALAGWLMNNKDEAEDIRIKLDPGDSAISFRSTSKKARAAFDMARIGLELIENGYPESLVVDVLY